MIISLLSLFGVLICSSGVLGAQNLLKDGDFEEGKYPTGNWYCNGNCHMTPEKADKISGSQSLKFSGRKEWWEGPSQQVALQRNKRYHATFFVKQLNSVPEKVFQEFRIIGQFEINGANVHSPDFAVDKNVHQRRGWVKLEAYFKTPDISFVKARVVVFGPEPAIEYLVDGGIVTEVEEDVHWKADADKRIDQLRKNNINLQVNIPSNTNPHDYTVEVKLNKHSFPFGSMIKTDQVIESKYHMHRDLYYYMFNWATLASYYWKWSKGPWNHPDYSEAKLAIKELQKHGIPIRAHNVFWGNAKFMPDEAMKLSASELKTAVDDRIRYVVANTKGMVDHWDVNNEMLHNHYFEEKIGDPYYSHHMYSYLHQLDPHAKLFINDYGVISDGNYVSAFVSQAQEYKQAKVGLYGMGIQCHFPENQEPDATLIRKRLDQLATTGYPIWVTELDIVVADENIRSKWYDIILRVLFSHHAIEGVIFWDFYGPQHWRGPNAGLVSGPDYRVNPAGKHYLDLLYNEWSTHHTHNLGSGKSFNVRGFHGDYEVIVKYKGTAIKDQKFTLGKSDKTVHITVTDIHAHPNIVTTPAPNLNEHGSNENHKVVRTGDFSLGTTASSASSNLECTTRWSGFSEIGDDKYVDAFCPNGYILTGCNSESKAPSDKKDGESIQKGGVMSCRAWNGYGASTPVQAVARCCKKTGLTCDYRQSHPSPEVFNVRVETPCPQHMFATGCSAHNFVHEMAGVYPTPTSCIAQNHGFSKGIDSFAICCKAPNFKCVVKKSNPSGLHVGAEAKLGCDPGYIMTGCHSFSEDEGLSATFINGNVCSVKNGSQKPAGMKGVTAYATCCK